MTNLENFADGNFISYVDAAYPVCGLVFKHQELKKSTSTQRMSTYLVWESHKSSRNVQSIKIGPVRYYRLQSDLTSV